MIIEFADDDIRLLIETGKSDNKLYKKLSRIPTFMRDLQMAYKLISIVGTTSELMKYKKLHYEKLKYDYQGKSSVRIGFTSKYRLIFEEYDNGIRVCLIEINEHYGDK